MSKSCFDNSLNEIKNLVSNFFLKISRHNNVIQNYNIVIHNEDIKIKLFYPLIIFF